MKKGWIILVNVAIVAAVLLMVVAYARNESTRNMAAQTEAFESMTVAMEQVAENYLEGEQRVCDSWANTINAQDMTLQEAISFVGNAVTQSNTMGHILFIDDGSMAGLSTVPRRGLETDFSVSYATLRLLEPALSEPGQAIHMTRAYTNPINGIQSIGFWDRIHVREAEGTPLREALLLRIIPVSAFEKEWSFPTDQYKKAEISLIDSAGDYIIRSRSFKNSNYYEFFKSYNATDYAALTQLQQTISTQTGTFRMLNSKGASCVIAHTPVLSTVDWVLLTYIPVSELGSIQLDWGLIGIVSAGLLLLLIFDSVIMLRFNRKLKQAALDAERANQAKTDFLSTMSHDIRTPMNAIIGLTTIASKNVDDPVSIRENLHKINLASSHLLTLINDILDITKVESGKLTLSPVTFSIRECAENLVNISQPMVKEKNIDFHFRVSRIEHEYLFADQLRINQIYINILSNAIKYTEPGGRVSLDLREEPGPDDRTVRLIYTVQDTGIGMTPEFMKKMYEPFSRQTDSRVNSVQGTGLGLAITRQMVSLMNGTIDCQSRLGEGTTFTVRLDIPLADRPDAELNLDDVRVLVADDDAVLLETVSDTLLSIGAKPETVSTGEQAVAETVRCQQSGAPYQVVILDWKMPDMDGIEAARRIRSQVGSDVPILLISAYDWSDMEEAARDAGVNAFITKPLFRTTLYDKIHELMGTQSGPLEQEDDTHDIAGMHILVAEDNDINWEIISTLLGMHGIEAERAENGSLAVERMSRAKEGEFDLIFMDIQMPVMNGLDATRAIRQLPDPYASHIPIIAMTADAFSENVSECMKAGMNGHIAKPIDMKLVIKEIRRIKEARS